MTDGLDRIIDDVAREMTEHPAPVDLRARVVSEIRGTSLQARLRDEAHHRDEANASYYLAGLAAAAGVILAMYLAWPVRQAVETPATPSPTVRRKPSAPHVVPAPGTDRAVPPGARAGGPARRAPSEPEPAFASALPALSEPVAIGIPPIDEPVAEIARLAVAPLDIAEIDIKALTPPR
jgi:hypothetical protein